MVFECVDDADRKRAADAATEQLLSRPGPARRHTARRCRPRRSRSRSPRPCVRRPPGAARSRGGPSSSRTEEPRDDDEVSRVRPQKTAGTFMKRTTALRERDGLRNVCCSRGAYVSVSPVFSRYVIPRTPCGGCPEGHTRTRTRRRSSRARHSGCRAARDASRRPRCGARSTGSAGSPRPRLPPRYIGLRSARRTTGEIATGVAALCNTEAMSMPSTEQSARREAIETEHSPRSNWLRKPLVRPAALATCCCVSCRATRSTRSCAPMPARSSWAKASLSGERWGALRPVARSRSPLSPPAITPYYRRPFAMLCPDSPDCAPVMLVDTAKEEPVTRPATHRRLEPPRWRPPRIYRRRRRQRAPASPAPRR